MAIIDTLKFNLGISGDTQDTELESVISRSRANLNELAGVTLDFDSEGLPQALLLECCRYIYNNAFEYFEENFKKEILRMQLQAAVSELDEE